MVCISCMVYISLPDLTESSFPKEVTDKKGIYYKGKDVNGHPIREIVF